jgi:hypothetical protein
MISVMSIASVSVATLSTAFSGSMISSRPCCFSPTTIAAMHSMLLNRLRKLSMRFPIVLNCDPGFHDSVAPVGEAEKKTICFHFCDNLPFPTE